MVFAVLFLELAPAAVLSVYKLFISFLELLFELFTSIARYKNIYILTKIKTSFQYELVNYVALALAKLLALVGF